MSLDPRHRITLLGKLLGANFNTTGDQLIGIIPSNVIVTQILVTNASISLTTAAGGFYSAASKGGTPIVAAAQVYSALTTSVIALNLTIAAFLRITANQIFFALTTAQGAPATADIYVYGADLTMALVGGV